MIKNVQLQDRGQYLCTAQNTFGSDRMVITLAVLTQPPKILPPNPPEISVYLGRSVNLDCLAEGKPKAQISWILPDKTFVREVGLPDSRAVLLTNGTLRIPAVNFSSKGDYKCIASNAAGADTVTYRIHVAALPPTIKEVSMETITIHTGRSIYVHCTVKGEPTPVLKWSLPGAAQIKPSQYLGSRFFVFPNGTLFVRSVSQTDSGKYECSATNAVGSTRRVVQLDIRQVSTSTQRSVPQQHRVTAMYGSTVYLHCPESTSTKRAALWRLPSKTLLDYRYRYRHTHARREPRTHTHTLACTHTHTGTHTHSHAHIFCGHISTPSVKTYISIMYLYIYLYVNSIARTLTVTFSFPIMLKLLFNNYLTLLFYIL